MLSLMSLLDMQLGMLHRQLDIKTTVQLKDLARDRTLVVLQGRHGFSSYDTGEHQESIEHQCREEV